MNSYAYNESFAAHECPNGHLTYPGHELCPECGEPQTETHTLADRVGEVVTWTTSMATPPGVREPNTLAIVEFEFDGGRWVRALGQVTTDEVETGDEVRAVYADQLREPGAGIREPNSQQWDGYQFKPIE